jgi:hypothetical protein
LFILWGQKEMLILNSNPMHFHKAPQNLLMNFEFRFDTMSFTRPWCLNKCVRTNLPVSWAVALSLVGMKCVILLNRSTTTMMASNLLDGGKLTKKFHFHHPKFTFLKLGIQFVLL